MKTVIAKPALQIDYNHKLLHAIGRVHSIIEK